MTLTQPADVTTASEMSATVDMPALKRALAAVKFAVPKRTYLAVLAGVKIEAGEGGLTLTTTDLDVFAKVTVAGATITAPGSVLVDHKSLAAIASGKGAAQLEASAFVLTVRPATGAQSSLPLLPIIEYPKVETVAEGAEFELPTAVLSDVLAAACTDQTLPVIGAVYLFGDQFAATDRYRLHVVKLPGALPMPEPTLIPSNLLKEVAKVKGADVAKFTVRDRGVLVEVGGRIMGGRLVEGAFPNFGQLIPDAGEVAKFDVAGMAAIAAGFAKMAGGATSPDPMTLEPTDDGSGVVASFTSSDSSNSSTVTVAGTVECRIGLKPAYLAALLDGLSERAVVETYGPLKPIKVTDSRDGWDVVRVLMPVRM